jgi:copper homeostasis protein (lipoprotein)
MMKTNLVVTVLVTALALACAPQEGPAGGAEAGDEKAPAASGPAAAAESDAGPGATAGLEEDTLWLKGMYSYMADAGLFTDCVTDQRLPVAMEGDYPALERAYLDLAPAPGEPILVTLEGRLERRPAMEGAGEVETVIVDKFHRARPGEECP